MIKRYYWVVAHLYIDNQFIKIAAGDYSLEYTGFACTRETLIEMIQTIKADYSQYTVHIASMALLGEDRIYPHQRLVRKIQKIIDVCLMKDDQILLEVIPLATTSGDSKGGIGRGWRATHLPSGTIGICTKYKSPHLNKHTAKRRLAEALAAKGE